jgi:alpha-mannosidase II
MKLHSGQAHGVASLRQGELEVMLDRQLVYDDERGLGQGVTDNKPSLSEHSVHESFDLVLWEHYII